MPQRKTSLLFLIIFVILPTVAFSQGFDWQFSSRLPTNSPTKFIGITGNFQISADNSRLNFTEEYSHCCTFSGGSGSGFQAGIRYEQWIAANTALFSGLTFNKISSSFRREATEPLTDGILRTEYRFDSYLTYIGLTLGSKHRISGTHFHAGGSLELSTQLNNTNEFHEKVISPPEWPWHERTIFSGSISGYNKILLSPAISAGYDFSLGLGMYGTVWLSAGFPLMSITGSEDWRRWGFYIGVSVLRGIFY
jgi:hypothetical protein